MCPRFGDNDGGGGGEGFAQALLQGDESSVAGLALRSTVRSPAQAVVATDIRHAPTFVDPKSAACTRGAGATKRNTRQPPAGSSQGLAMAPPWIIVRVAVVAPI